jgi:catechol 2,3-dioxygenase-like lactoylglutathione lyase family enzyme
MTSASTAGQKFMSEIVTRIQSVSVPVADQDRALAFYTEVLGCQVRTDVEVWPGARWIEVVPPNSDIGIALLPADGEIPVGVRLGTRDADAAHAELTASGAEVHEGVLRLDFAPPMFTFADPDQNLLVLIEEESSSTGENEGTG